MGVERSESEGCTLCSLVPIDVGRDGRSSDVPSCLAMGVPSSSDLHASGRRVGSEYQRCGGVDLCAEDGFRFRLGLSKALSP